jgi:hypothetical protein
MKNEKRQNEQARAAPYLANDNDSFSVLNQALLEIHYK